MTETAATEEAEQQIEVEQPQPQKNEALASKHGYIDLDKIDDPEVRQAVQDRLTDLYHSRKETTTALGEMQRLYGGMEKKLADLEAAQSKKDTDSKLDQVRKGIADAQAKGDYETATKLNEELIVLKQPKPVQQQPQEDALTPAQESALFAWQAEMTEDGRIVRPWANPSSPKYRQTIAELKKAYETPEIASQGFHAVLDAVHEKMAPKPKQTSPVADGDATPRRQATTTTKLTPAEQRVARKMYPNEKDPIAAYVKAKKLYGAE